MSRGFLCHRGEYLGCAQVGNEMPVFNFSNAELLMKLSDRVQNSHEEQELCMTRLDWVEDSTQSVWNFWRTLKLSIKMKTMLF